MQIFPSRKKWEAEYLGKIGELETQLQHAIDILVAKPDSSETYKGNQYTTYSSQVSQIDKMYNGTADWGNQITRNIIDVRAAFTIGSGVKLKGDSKKAKRELEFLKSFINFNKIDFWRALQWATEAEIEGKFLCILSPDKDAANIRVKFLEWTANEYTVKTKDDDYADYVKVEYKVGKKGADKTLKPGQFIYKKFAGRESKVNETTPKIGMIITAIQDLDKALWDWRKINHLFASPTPYFKAETEEKAKKTNAALNQVNWKIGKKLVTAADFSMVGAPMEGSVSIENEIKTKAKFVSGGTGVPVHFLGFVDLMSNRATADNLMEMVFASTTRERTLWMDTFNEMFDRAIELQNKNNNGGLKPGIVTCDIPYVSASKMQELVDVWFPLYQDNGISLDTFLSKIPEIDPETEKKQIEKDQEKARQDFLTNWQSKEENQDAE